MSLRYAVLGTVEVHHGAALLPLGGSKQRAVLGMLALHAGEPVASNLLAEVVWGDPPPPRGRHTLQVYVSALRRVLRDAGGVGITWHGGAYVLETGRDSVDALLCDDLLAAARAAADTGDWGAACDLSGQALAMWRGDPLGELGGDTVVLAPLRERYREARLATIELHAEALLALGREADAVRLLHEPLSHNPLRERLAELSMLAMYRSGRQADALDLARRMRRALGEELGVDPGPALQRLELAILQHQPVLEQDHEPPPKLALPRFRTSLIGRDVERARVTESLATASGLVTLVGPGGVGKTRLALAAATDAAALFPDGIAFISLDQASEPGDALTRLALQVGVPVKGAASLAARLHRRLADARMLLVLDTADRLPPDGGLLPGLLSEATRIVVLATSRTPLGLAGERVVAVQPLAVSEQGELDPRGSPALRLFAERASAADSSFVLDESTLPLATAVVRRLDGLPLAVELAAGRVRDLGLAGLVESLDRALDVLVGGPSDGLARHRSLRETIRWTEELLDDEQRRLLACLGLFPAGAAADAVRAVCGAGVDDADVAYQLGRLVDHGLVQRFDGRRACFVLPSTVREEVSAQIAELEDLHELRRSQAAHYIDVLAVRERGLVEVVDTDLDNVTDVLEWALGAAPEIAAELCIAAEEAWLAGQRAQDLLQWARRLLQRGSELSVAMRARLHGGVAAGLLYAGDADAARASFGACLELMQEAGSINEEMPVLYRLGVTALGQGELDFAGEVADRMTLVGGEQCWRAWTLHGYLANEQEDHRAARAWHSRWLADAVRRDDDKGAEYARLALASTTMLEGDPATAYGQAVAVRRRAQSREQPQLVHAATVSCLWAALANGQFSDALSDALAVIDAATIAGNRFDIATALLCVGAAAAASGRSEDAALLAGAAQLLDDSGGTVRPVQERRICQPWIQSAAAALGPERFGTAYEHGRCQPTELSSDRARSLTAAVLERSLSSSGEHS